MSIERKIIICVDEHGRGCKTKNQVTITDYVHHHKELQRLQVRKVMEPENCTFCGKPLSVGQ